MLILPSMLIKLAPDTLLRTFDSHHRDQAKGNTRCLDPRGKMQLMTGNACDWHCLWLSAANHRVLALGVWSYCGPLCAGCGALGCLVWRYCRAGRQAARTGPFLHACSRLVVFCVVFFPNQADAYSSIMNIALPLDTPLKTRMFLTGRAVMCDFSGAQQLPRKRKEEKKRKATKAVKTLPASIKEKRIPRAEAPCIPFTKRNKKEVNGDQEGY
eukprot:1160649-Pelagomonas_calceolata.AAC.1